MKNWNKIKAFGIFMLLLVLLFFQHVACFDVFSSNLWYLYVLAAIFAALQYVLLLGFCRSILSSGMGHVICMVYAIVAILKAFQLLSSLHYDPYPLGLPILCLVFDITGLIIALFAGKRRVSEWR